MQPQIETGAGPSTPAEKETVGQWALLRPLGSGSFGTTWLAGDDRGHQVALKLLTAPPGDELRALARLAHPAIPRLVDSGSTPQPWMAMELATGTPLSELVLHASQVPGVFAVVFDALAAVHRGGLVHGDIKPDHIVVDDTLDVRIIDFGMVGLAGGTPDFAAPEQLCGRGPSAAGDVYSAAMCLWRALHGALPFDELAPSERLRARLELPVAPQVGDPWMRDLLRDALAKDCADRPTAAQIVDRFASRSHAVPEVTAESLRRRASLAHWARPAVDDAVREWVRQGGRTSLIGGPGSGRSHHLKWAEVELQAVGGTVAWMSPGPSQWSAATSLLQTAQLVGSPRELPPGHDLERAQTAAKLIVARARGPLWLLVDDLLALDEGSLLVLHALRQFGDVHVLSAGPEALPGAAPVALAPLDRADVAALAGTLLGEGDLQAAVQHLFERADGRADRVVQGLISALQVGAVVRPVARWLVDDDRLERVQMGAVNAGQLIGDPVTVAVAVVVAASSAPLSLSAVRQVSQLPRVVDHLDDLRLLGLIRRERGEWSLVQGAYAQSLRDLVTPQIHGRLLDRLLEDGDANAADVAHHAAGAGRKDAIATSALDGIAQRKISDPTAALRLAEACAIHCDDVALMGELMRLLVGAGRGQDAIARAVEFLGSMPVHVDQVPVRLGLITALAAVERFSEAWATVDIARASLMDQASADLDHVELDLLFHQGRHAEVVERAADCLRQTDKHHLRVGLLHAQSLHALGRPTDGLELLDRLKELDVTGDQRGIIWGIIGRLLWHTGRIADAAHAFDEAHNHALNAVTRAKMANNGALAHYTAGELDHALTSWEKAIVLFERLNLRSDLVRVLVNVVVGYGDAGRWARASDAAERAMDLGEQLGLPEYVAMAAGNLGDVSLHRHDFEGAANSFALAAKVAAEHALAGEQVELARRFAQLALESDADNAQHAVNEALRVAIDAQDDQETRRSRALQAVLRARSGDGAAALDTLDADMATLRNQGAAKELAELRLWRATVHEALHHHEQSLEDITRVQAYANESGLVSLHTRAERVRVRVAANRPTPEQSDLERLLLLTAELGRHLDLRPLLEHSALAARELVGADRCLVILGDADNWRIAASSRANNWTHESPSTTVLRRALGRGRSVVVTDLGERAFLRGAESVLAMDLRFVICIPLIERDVVLGALYVDGGAIMDRALDRTERLLSALAQHLTVAVARVHNERQLRRSARRAVAVARDVRGMLMVIEANAQDVMLDLGPEQAQPMRALQDVLLANDRVQRMLDNLLRPGTLGCKPSSLAEAVQAQIQLLTRRARFHAVLLEADLDDQVLIDGGVDVVSRLASNLIHRALRACQPGDHVSVRVCSRNGRAIIEVLHPSAPSVGDQPLDLDEDPDLEYLASTAEELDGHLQVRHDEHGYGTTVDLPLAQ